MVEFCNTLAGRDEEVLSPKRPLIREPKPGWTERVSATEAGRITDAEAGLCRPGDTPRRSTIWTGFRPDGLGIFDVPSLTGETGSRDRDGDPSAIRERKGERSSSRSRPGERPFGVGMCDVALFVVDVMGR